MPFVQGTGADATSEHALPAGQLVHPVVPFTEAYVPLAHVVHEVVPPRDAVPAAHCVGTCGMRGVELSLAGKVTSPGNCELVLEDTDQVKVSPPTKRAMACRARLRPDKVWNERVE